MPVHPDRRASLSDIVASVPDGSHLALAGFAITRNAMAFAHELIRSGTRRLTLTQVIGGLETDLLVAAGAVDRLNYGGGSIDRFGPLHGTNQAVLAHRLDLYEHSALALALRLHAGALGLPYLTTRSMLGSDLVAPLVAAGEVEEVVSPFDGKPCLALSPLRPDVAVIHVDVADKSGNAVVSGPQWSIPETARSSATLALVTEELVDDGDIDPSLVTIPGVLVEAVAPVSRGSYPTALFGHYDYDAAHLRLYAAAGAAGPAALEEYLDRWVRGAKSFDEFVARATA